MRKQANRDISSDSKVTVSIVLPVYNGEHFLHQSVDSIIKQSFKNYELIIVDDCSTDNSLKIAESFAAKDKRISVIHNKVNQKLPESLNIGFAKARGKYLTWTSDDNIAKPDWLKTMVEYLDKNSSVDMVVGTMDLINERDEFISATVKKNNVRSLTYRNNVGAVFMYRKSIADQIGKYDIGSFGVEDWDYWCRIALNGTIGYIPDNLYSYRIHDNSLSSLYREDILKKMAFIQDKYSDKLVDRFNLNWWNKTKVKYLRTNRKYQPIFVLFDIYKFLLKNMTNLLLFWNRKLRRRTYAKYQIQV